VVPSKLRNVDAHAFGSLEVNHDVSDIATSLEEAPTGENIGLERPARLHERVQNEPATGTEDSSYRPRRLSYVKIANCLAANDEVELVLAEQSIDFLRTSFNLTEHPAEMPKVIGAWREIEENNMKRASVESGAGNDTRSTTEIQHTIAMAHPRQVK
jgi:hypothetical protein